MTTIEQHATELCPRCKKPLRDNGGAEHGFTVCIENLQAELAALRERCAKAEEDAKVLEWLAENSIPIVWTTNVANGIDIDGPYKWALKYRLPGELVERITLFSQSPIDLFRALYRLHAAKEPSNNAR